MGKSVDCLLRRARNLVKPEAKRITVDPSRRTHGISLPGNPSPPSRLFSNVSRSIRSSLSVYSLSLDLTKKKKKNERKKTEEREREVKRKRRSRDREIFNLAQKFVTSGPNTTLCVIQQAPISQSAPFPGESL